MKVCIISTAHNARDDRLFYKEACSLAKEHEVTLIAPLLHGDSAWTDESITFHKLNSSLSKTDRIYSALCLLFSLNRGQYDVIHIVDAELIPLILLFRFKAGSKIVCDIWEANYELIYGPSDNPSALRKISAVMWRELERFVAKHCDLVITADAAIAKGLGPSVRATVIYNYPLLSALEFTIDEKKALQQKLGAKRYIIYHGSMAEERGILKAVEMMLHIKRKHSDVALLLVGRIAKNLDIEISALVAQHKLGENVVRHEFIDYSMVGKYLAIAEFGIVPFYRTKKFEKNIPQKIFEYWAVGIPLIATDLPPIRDYVSLCDGGVLVASNDPVELADAAVYLLDNPSLAMEMGARGKLMVESTWRWESVEKQLLDSYRKLEV